MSETAPSAKTGVLRWIVRGLVALVLAGLLAYLAARRVGYWLVVYDPLMPARAIAVLSGGPPFRAMEGAKLYRAGWAPEVWLTHPVLAEEPAFRSLGIEYHAEEYYNTQVLEKLGVPASAIRVLPDGVLNTASEDLAIFKELKKVGGTRVIIVTSEPHTRRTRAIWHTLIGDTPELIVRGAPEDTFDPGRWWRNTHDAESVSHEVLGLVNVWCGFPARPDRP
jgi:uncharacterized SAM-binding protein YcdF (DUF218 family)